MYAFLQAHYNEKDAQILQIFSDLPEDENDIAVELAADDDDEEDPGIQGSVSTTSGTVLVWAAVPFMWNFLNLHCLLLTLIF